MTLPLLTFVQIYGVLSESPENKHYKSLLSDIRLNSGVAMWKPLGCTNSSATKRVSVHQMAGSTLLQARAQNGQYAQQHRPPTAPDCWYEPSTQPIMSQYGPVAKSSWSGYGVSTTSSSGGGHYPTEHQVHVWPCVLTEPLEPEGQGFGYDSGEEAEDEHVVDERLRRARKGKRKQ